MATPKNTKRNAPKNPAAAAVRETLRAGTQEIGASGTPNYGGYITSEDYNPDLDGKKAIELYDKMRRSDAQVQASLEVLKQPLLSGAWSVEAPTDATPQEEEIADFCQEALFGHGAMQDPWSYALEHILLMLDFGVSPLEKVYELRDDGRIWFKRLAPRLPRTIERFDVDENGRLVRMMQYAVKDNGFGSFEIPAEYLALFINRREGDNYFGRSVLRTAYQHWYYKTDAYRTLAVQRHRFGVGIPRAVTKADATFSPDELTKIDTMLQNLVAHERAWIRHSDKFVVDILMPQGGQNASKGAIADVEHHSMMIARNVLADFMQGTGDGLNSSRTRSLIDFFISALYDKAGTICGTLTSDVLKPLCDLNFTMQGHRYPKVLAADLADVDLKGLTEQLSKLGPDGFITPTDDDETMLRKLMGMPPLPEQFKGLPRGKKPQPGPCPDCGGTGYDRESTKDAEKPCKTCGGTGQAPQAAPTSLRRGAAVTLRATKAKKTFELHGRVYARRPTDFELKVFSIAEVPDQLDLEAKALAATLVDIRRRQLTTLASQIAKKDARKTGAFTDIRPGEFAVPLKAEVKRELKATLTRAAEFGSRQVRLELHRQGALIALNVPAADFDTILLDNSAGASKRNLGSALTTSADVTAEKVTDAWFNRILETGVRLRRAGTAGEALAGAIVGALSQELETGVLRDAKGEVHEGFALGRAAEAAKHASEIETVEYSCLLDASSCSPCALLDGMTFAYGSAQYFETMPPYKDCDGNKGTPDACRCVHLFLWKGK